MGAIKPPTGGFIDVSWANGEAKFWLAPTVHLARNSGFDARTLKKLATLVAENKDDLERVWNDYFG